MIKRKGVCDVCKTEFELSDGTFAIKIMEDKLNCASKKWTITVLSCINDCPEVGFSHVCGLTCLYEAIEDAIEKKAEGCRFGMIGYNDTDDSTTQVLDLTDKRAK